ncbi:hypothetical protein K8I28_11270 [bacterium]|nr:hypothetical protein [bacterium]
MANDKKIDKIRDSIDPTGTARKSIPMKPIANPEEVNKSLSKKSPSDPTKHWENALESGEPGFLPFFKVSCPVCDGVFDRNCERLDEEIICPKCATKFQYVDGYLNNFKAYIEIFIDRVFPLPMVPGYTTGGDASATPDDLTLIDFGVTYNKPPEVFFLLSGGRASREMFSANQFLMPLSIGVSNFVLFSRSFDPRSDLKDVIVHWRAIGEIGEFEKPLWLNYLQNAADLVRNDEDVAAVVMLLIALDFYYDHVLDRLEIGYDVIRREGRRPGMNEKRAKLKLIEERLGAWPASIDQHLRDLTDYRNRIVHRVVKRPGVQSFNGRRAFQIVMRSILFMIEMFYRTKNKHK